MRVTGGTVLIRAGDDLRDVALYDCKVIVDTERECSVDGLVDVLRLMDVDLGNTTINGCLITTTAVEGQVLAQAVVNQAKHQRTPTLMQRAIRAIFPPA